MSEGRKCCIYLLNERKLELTVQHKILTKELLEIVATHFKLQDKEYFGIAYRSDSGHLSWLQDDKKVLEHELVRKTSGILNLQFAVRFFVENVTTLQHNTSIELFFLQVKSQIYKGQLEVESETAFQLAAYVLQVVNGNYVNDETALSSLRKLPVLSNKIFKEHLTSHCENAVLQSYKELTGYSKGKAILSYMSCVESLPTYGVHFYKVKDKSGIPWWLGLSFKGILQFQYHDKSAPVKTYYWRQLENLYFREKKFSIEVSEKLQRKPSGGAKDILSVEIRKKSAGVVHAWYGSPSLIKSIWVMSIAQHHFYLDRKQNNKSKVKGSKSLTELTENLSNNKNSLIGPVSDTPVMTRKQIKDVDVTVKKGSKDETPEVQAAKRDLSKALVDRRTELEDRLYDKVQDLKRLCLEESEFTGKLPQEFIRYMDRNERAPKVKKRIGAEFKVKLRNKNGTSVDKNYSANVTSVSGFISDPADELCQLETEFEILTQIANASKKLASDTNTKGRIRHKRLGSYKKNIKKLQTVEGKINDLRKKTGQKPSERASMFIADDSDDMFDIGICMKDGTESERSSLSGGMHRDDDTSLSSGADALSTHSTPAILNRTPQHPASAVMSRRNISPSDVDISDVQIQRSLTPPPSFGRRKKIDSSNVIANGLRGDQYTLLPSPELSSGVSMDSVKTQQTTSTRNWVNPKWEVPKSRPSRGWHESSLDSIDTTSTGSRLSEETRSTDPEMVTESSYFTSSSTQVTRPLESSLPAQKVDLRPSKPPSLEKLAPERPTSANSNQNNHNFNVKKNLDVFNMGRMRREVSDGALSDLSIKSNPAILSTNLAPENTEQREELPKIVEVSPLEQMRKRSSSMSDPPSNHTSHPRRGPKTKSKNDRGTLKSKHQPQYLQSPFIEARNVQQAFAAQSAIEAAPGTTEKNPPELQPPIFDTNLNIRMQYQNRNNLPQTAPAGQMFTQVDGYFPALAEQRLTRDPPSIPGVHNVVGPPPQYYYPVNQFNGGEHQYTPPLPHAPPVGEIYPNQPHPSYGYPIHPHYHQPYAEAQAYGLMTNSQRDMLNNEVYQDIGMGWVPSLHDYSSRASVCESASAQSKKEDILRLLEDHIATKRTPSNASSKQERNLANKQRKIREEYQAAQRQNLQEKVRLDYQKQTHEKTWANYQKQALYAKDSSKSTNQHQSEQSDASRLNFIHSSKDASSLLYKTQQHPRVPQQRSTHILQPAQYNTASEYGNQATGWHDDRNMKNQLLLQHYMHHDRVGDPLDYVHATPRHQAGHPTSNQQFYAPAPSDGKQMRPPPQRWTSQPSEPVRNEKTSTGVTGPGTNTVNVDDGLPPRKPPHSLGVEPVVIQSLTKSPEGHPVSVFTVTKSAPNTPLPKRHNGASFFDYSSSSDDEVSGKRSTIKRNPCSQHHSFEDLLDDSVSSSGDEKPFSTPSKTPTIILHTPSVKRKKKPTMSVETPGAPQNPTQVGPDPDNAPMPPPRMKQLKVKQKLEMNDISRLSVADARTIFESKNPPNKTSHQSGKRAPTPTRSSSVTSHLVGCKDFEGVEGVKHAKSNSVPVVHSGTLPRAFKSKRKVNRSGRTVSGVEAVPIVEVSRKNPGMDPRSRSRGPAPKPNVLRVSTQSDVSPNPSLAYSRADVISSPMPRPRYMRGLGDCLRHVSLYCYLLCIQLCLFTQITGV
ncbi:unnamed protein product [Clavelina lepadiformis]|uniref:FERM domain-containing protein n=2 Tax=Clavelina lepadiformis TaxID=159417 RepID=A0ABP0GH00_CLALP